MTLVKEFYQTSCFHYENFYIRSYPLKSEAKYSGNLKDPVPEQFWEGVGIFNQSLLKNSLSLFLSYLDSCMHEWIWNDQHSFWWISVLTSIILVLKSIYRFDWFVNILTLMRFFWGGDFTTLEKLVRGMKDKVIDYILILCNFHLK